MKIAHDNTGVVRMHGESLPTEWNGMSLTVTALSAEQESAYLRAAGEGSGVVFSEGEFRAIPPAVPTPVEVIVKIEQQNPITHRALRELILTIGEAFPAGKETVFYKRVLQTELAIRAEREKL